MLKAALKTMAMTALMALVLTGCNRHKETPKTDTSKPPATVAPLAFAKTDPDAQVTLTLPEPIKLYPELHTQLYNQGVDQLNKFIDDAHKGRAEEKANGFDAPPYSHGISWNIAAQSARFLSLFAVEDDYEGGAHPSTTFQALLWDKSKNDLINTAQIFAPGADTSAVDTFICKQIEAARAKRLGQPVNQAQDGFPCPKITDSRLILIPSTLQGKIGAVDVLFAPSEVGAYAEGPYEIRVPQAQLNSILVPEYADQFAGDATSGPALPDPDTANDNDKAS